ncbi:MAG: multifunctional oxoglutarate decarboxylase/oxoglutarate dehydrogenase thiamine pyrophosphate-binding subunit/dihydrolipoyllysine-residue succinyltransferase subunit, partial [Actinomycetota bacterium]
AEALAFGSLLREGTSIRLTGQDTRRGTFSQRHSVLVDQETGEEYLPLRAILDCTGAFHPCDSLLSEFAALGFEYGYSVANPESLVLWEAQFGDFVNGGQFIIDQFIAAGEDKWGQVSGLVLLLPHGYEGQGPEHSSARIERFLDLAADDNIQVVVPSTPAQYFHVLRRQAHRAVRKPLIVMTPKSLLRLPAARSAADDFTTGGFREVLADAEAASRGEVSRVILCQGKVFYDLAKYRSEHEVQGAAILRLEQPYPFPAQQLKEELEPMVGADELFWVQEEPENMGSWRFVDLQVRRVLGRELTVISRDDRSSPATGSLRIHRQEQDELVSNAFAGLKQKNSTR